MEKNAEKPYFSLDSGVVCGIIEKGESPANLDNGTGETELTSVQASREFTTTDGCHVDAFFRKEHDPSVRREIARLLLAAFEERNVDDETRDVSVQGVDERTGRQ